MVKSSLSSVASLAGILIYANAASAFTSRDADLAFDSFNARFYVLHNGFGHYKHDTEGGGPGNWTQRSIPNLNERLYGLVTGRHRFEECGELGQGGFSVHKIAGMDDAGLDAFEGAADGAGGVVEAGKEGEVGVMQEAGVERDGSAGGATAKEVDAAAFADELDGRFPDFRLADGFDDGVERRV
jgi:hypothetical protein